MQSDRGLKHSLMVHRGPFLHEQLIATAILPKHLTCEKIKRRGGFAGIYVASPSATLGGPKVGLTCSRLEGV